MWPGLSMEGIKSNQQRKCLHSRKMWGGACCFVLGLYKGGKFANNKPEGPRRPARRAKLYFDLWISSNFLTDFLCIYGRSAGNFPCHCAEVLGESWKSSLLVLHSFTGCDCGVLSSVSFVSRVLVCSENFRWVFKLCIWLIKRDWDVWRLAAARKHKTFVISIISFVSILYFRVKSSEFKKSLSSLGTFAEIFWVLIDK